MSTRICPRCNKERRIGAFVGRDVMCRICRSELTKRYENARRASASKLGKAIAERREREEAEQRAELAAISELLRKHREAAGERCS